MESNQVNRRDFLQKASGFLAAAPFFNSLDFSVDDKPYMTFDFHAHPGLFFAKETKMYPGDGMLKKTLADIKEGKLTGAFFSLVADAKVIEIGPTGVKPSRSYEPNEAWAEYNRQIKIL
ncbi:MAG: hypothetical protein ABIN24_00020, partial [Dyadobacter sp.]